MSQEKLKCCALPPQKKMMKNKVYIGVVLCIITLTSSVLYQNLKALYSLHRGEWDRRMIWNRGMPGLALKDYHLTCKSSA